ISWHSEHSHGSSCAACCQVHALFIPCAESTSPAPGRVHLRDDGLLATDVAPQVDDTLEEHPPVIGVLTFSKKLDPGLCADVLAALDELHQLRVAQAVKQAQRAQLLDADTHGQSLRWRTTRLMRE